MTEKNMINSQNENHMVFNLLIKINNDYLNNKKNGKKE